MGNNINILNTITSIHDGGLERLVYYILSFQENKMIKHHVAIFTKQKRNSLLEKYEKLNVEIKYFDFDNRLFSYKSLLKNARECIKLAKYIRKSKINVLHTHDFFPAFITRISTIVSFLFFFYKVDRTYVTLHNVFVWLKPYHHFLNRVLSIITSRIICLSHAIKDHSLKNDKIRKAKYLINYTGVDTRRFIPDPDIRDKYLKEFGITPNRFIIGNIGVLSVRKGHKYLLYALTELIRKFPDILLLIFGSEREHEMQIRDEIYGIISTNKLEHHVRILEPREDIDKIYNIFDLFVMPSITEGLSACAIEAMLTERLCLFSDIPPFQELVSDGVNGFLFELCNADHLRKKTEYIIENYDDLHDMKKEARRSVIGKFDVRRMVEKYEELYLT